MHVCSMTVSDCSIKISCTFATKLSPKMCVGSWRKGGGISPAFSTIYNALTSYGQKLVSTDLTNCVELFIWSFWSTIVINYQLWYSYCMALNCCSIKLFWFRTKNFRKKYFTIIITYVKNSVYQFHHSLSCSHQYSERPMMWFIKLCV